MKRSPVLLAVFLMLCGDAGAATMGKCRFDTDPRSFAGTASEQASCLMRKVRPLGNVAAEPAVLPANLAALVGQPTGISKARMRSEIAALGFDEAGLGGSLDSPLSRGNANSAQEPMARYFVIHDTSTPNFGEAQFPADIDTSNKVNSFSGYKSPTNAKAHIFLNRGGEIYVGHDFGVPWRATKLELKIGKLAKGLFVHIETIQPRRAHPHQADGTAPDPGFTAAQYDRLALLYLMASMRAGAGLVPAFHAAIDEGLSDGHDDPQNFSLAEFDAALGRLLAKLRP
ncbi:hypothetical protein DFR52_102509 [Hoeflea marina]|uniref:N-acetylmuramoyl-L-alanine amidase n=1 Tax=Hoeflea marina TaxID=274592 RepID=A0A317PLK3_9HYPH|nr:N-acetylmuramoyl-L-alanine amidase [Hoeflea marina]PWW01845.1 hypothetical protein DFR52_102509 [Hoeflea marina]